MGIFPYIDKGECTRKDMSGQKPDMASEDIWMKGLQFCEEVVTEGEVNFMINGDTYKLTYENQWYQLRKNGGGYKSEFYTLGIKDRHDLADSLVEYVMGA